MTQLCCGRATMVAALFLVVVLLIAQTLRQNNYRRRDVPLLTTAESAKLALPPLLISVGQCAQAPGRSVASLVYHPHDRLKSDIDPPITEHTLDIILKAAKRPRGDPWLNLTWPSLSLQQHHPSSPPTLGVPYVRCLYRSALLAYAAHLKFIPWFVESFQRYHSSCEVLVLFVDDATVQMELDRTKANVVLENRLHWERLAHSTMSSPETVRVPVIAVWASQHASEYRYIATIDARDTVFYGNVFDEVARLGINDGLFNVAESHNFFTEKIYNSHWLTTYLNDGGFTVKAIMGRTLRGVPFPILCSGMYGGTAAAFLDYVTAFAKAIQAIPPATAKATPGLDQGVHIFLNVFGLATMHFPHQIWAIDPLVGPFTHWFPPSYAVLRDRSARLVNCRGEPYAFVHQADRYGHLWGTMLRPLSHPVPGMCRDPPSDATRRASSTVFEAQTAPVVPQTAVICRNRNAFLVGFESFSSVAAETLQRLVDSFARFHTACDTLVAVLPDDQPHSSPNGTVASFLSSHRPHSLIDLQMLTYGTRTESPTALHAVDEWVAAASKMGYTYCVVLENVDDSRLAVLSNVFAPLYERNFSGVFVVSDGSGDEVVQQRARVVEQLPEECRAQLLSDLAHVTAFGSLLYGGSTPHMSRFVQWQRQQAHTASTVLVPASCAQNPTVVRLHRAYHFKHPPGKELRVSFDSEMGGAAPYRHILHPPVALCGMSLIVGLADHGLGLVFRRTWQEAYPYLKFDNATASVEAVTLQNLAVPFTGGTTP